MAEFENYLGYCPVNEVLNLSFLQHEASYLEDSINFDQCYLEEEVRCTELTKALQELETDSSFAFYKLTLSEYETHLLSLVSINQYNNKVIYLSETDNLKDTIDNKLSELIGSNININPISRLITRLVSNILSVTGYDNAEVMLRTEGERHIDENNSINQCLYWHIDKSSQEIGINIEGNQSVKKEKQMLFIISLIGESTVFHYSNDQQRRDFFNIANETVFFYGHTSRCEVNDAVNQLFKYENINNAAFGYGSVHIAGKNGTVHAAPLESKDGRMLLLITPI